MTMDNTEGNCHHIRNSTISKTSSCSSSFTFVESTLSTTKLSLKSERCCPSLGHVPTHVLSAITAHLDVVSKICLQGVNHHFRKVVEVDRADLNACARYVLAGYFYHGTPLNGFFMTMCVLCKTSHSKERYSGDRIRCIKDPRREATSWTGHALARIPWVRHYASLDWNKTCLYRTSPRARPNCYDHFMEKFASDPHIESLMEFIEVPKTRAAWLAFRVWRCTHCGKSISQADTRLVGCVHCKCDFCQPTPSYQFRRCGPRCSDPILLRQIFRDPITKWTYAVEGYGKNMIVVPVLFPTHRTDTTSLQSLHMCYVHDPRVVRPDLITQMTSRRDSQARVEAEKLGSLGNKISTQGTPETVCRPGHSTFWDKIRRLRPTS